MDGVGYEKQAGEKRQKIFFKNNVHQRIDAKSRQDMQTSIRKMVSRGI